MSNQWLYLKIFFKFEQPLDIVEFESLVSQYLLDVVQPFFLRKEQVNADAPYFFIRYHEGGFHLRIRTRCDSAEEKTTLEQELTSESVEWQSRNINQSLQLGFVEPDHYQPELVKYGGEKNMEVVETHFKESSNIALQILSICQQTSIKAEYLSLWLTFESLQTIGLTPKEIVSVLSGYAKFWSEQLTAFQPNLKEQLLVRYRANQHQLSMFFSEEGEVAPFEEKHPMLNALKHRWNASLQRVMNSVRQHEINGDIQSDFSAHVLAQESKFISLTQVKSTPYSELIILPNLIHMLNNRIGVDVYKEAQLSFTICRYLCEQSGTTDVGFNMILEPGTSQSDVSTNKTTQIA